MRSTFSSTGSSPDTTRAWAAAMASRCRCDSSSCSHRASTLVCQLRSRWPIRSLRVDADAVTNTWKSANGHGYIALMIMTGRIGNVRDLASTRLVNVVKSNLGVSTERPADPSNRCSMSAQAYCGGWARNASNATCAGTRKQSPGTRRNTRPKSLNIGRRQVGLSGTGWAADA